MSDNHEEETREWLQAVCVVVTLALFLARWADDE
jgi:hypothetical protein